MLCYVMLCYVMLCYVMLCLCYVWQAKRDCHNALLSKTNALLAIKNKAFDNALLSKNNTLIWESNALVSKSTRCFSVSQQRVVLDFKSNALFSESNALFWEINALSKKLCSYWPKQRVAFESNKLWQYVMTVLACHKRT